MMLKEFDSHYLRHTHATIMLEIGESPKAVSERLAHSNVSIILDKYSHVTLNLQTESAENLAKALRKAATSNNCVRF